MSKLVLEDRVVFEGTDFVICDVSDLLPRHANFPHGTNVVKPNGKRAMPKSWHFKKVANRDIQIAYIHQTAGSVKYSGFEGLLNTFAFQVRDPAYNDEGKWTGRGRGWPGGGYPYYLPYRPLKLKSKVVIFRCWTNDWVTWHSSDNYHATALVCQGYFKSRHMKTFKARPGCDGKPSTDQMIGVHGFVLEYVIGELGVKPSNIRGHCHSPKPKLACPGDSLETMCLEYQEGRALPELPQAAPALLPKVSGLLRLDSWKERQAALVVLGHYLGSTGRLGNGVDGDPGDLTRAAVETEEENLGLRIDGYWDDTFDYHVKVQLAARLKTQGDINGHI